MPRRRIVIIRGQQVEVPTATAHVFYVSRNTRPPMLRVLWTVPMEDAKRICSDPSTAGENFMLCYTSYGVEHEDWQYVPDDGRFDDLLKRLDVTVIMSKKKRES